ncbi:putative nitrate transporter NarT [compost metagenome]
MNPGILQNGSSSGLVAGNGSVFQLVPQRFGSEIGLVTGIVGAAGGLGGYALPLILGRYPYSCDANEMA